MLPCKSYEKRSIPLLYSILTGPELWMPAAHDITTPAGSIVLRLLSLPIFFVLPTTMPPLPGYPMFHHAGQLVSNLKPGRLFQVSLVVLIIAAIAWVVVTYILQRKSRTINALVEVPEKPATRRLLERQDSALCQRQWELDHNDCLNSLKQEILQHTEKPIHPWVLPPQALPGPYDPMYYPLPTRSHRC